MTLADAVLVTLAAVAGWNLRFTVDALAAEADSTQQFWHSAAPWLCVVWMAFLLTSKAYPRRLHIGAPQLRDVLMASLATLCTVVTFTFFLDIELPRGFVAVTLASGTALLLAERFYVRDLLRTLAAQGRISHRAVAVGGSDAVAELVDVLDRQRSAGYTVCGACVPASASLGPDRMVVPRLGGVEDVRQACEEAGADTLVVSRDGACSETELWQIASELEGSEIELLVARSLTDVAGSPRVRMWPVAGLPLVHVEYPASPRTAGLREQLVRLWRSFLVPVLVALPMTLLTAVVLLLGER